jgi:hypothetical protein
MRGGSLFVIFRFPFYWDRRRLDRTGQRQGVSWLSWVAPRAFAAAAAKLVSSRDRAARPAFCMGLAARVCPRI